MSYDLGLNGDYPSLYAWLDEHDAKEAGDSVATFEYEFNGNNDDDLLSSLRNELIEKVPNVSNARVYIIRSKNVNHGNFSFTGSFIYGRRKGSPWEGYGNTGENEDDAE